MSRPGTQVTIRDTPAPRSAPTDTGVWFVTGITEKGPTTPTLITSLDQFISVFGNRVTYSILYDAIETFFREGGARVYISRVVGPNPVLATVDLNDAGAGVSLHVDATSVGAWANTLNVVVVAGDAGGEFKLQVTDDVAGLLDESPSLVDQAAAIAWASTSRWIRLRLGATANDPAVVAATSLAGGTDDHLNVIEANWTTALTRFTPDLGPGQVSAPGRTTTTAYSVLLDHADANNRVALLDGADTASDTTLKTATSALSVGDPARRGSFWAPWAVVPGITRGTTRTVPWSAVEAGMIARSDGNGNSANMPVAGNNGVSNFAIGLSQAGWTDAVRQELNEAGVNVAIVSNGVVKAYGYRSLADPTDDPDWIMLNNVRLFMALTAQGNQILEGFVFSEIDGRGRTLGRLHGLLASMCQTYYEEGSLFGDTAADAYNVDTGAQVNTIDTIAAGELRAALAVKASPEAELVTLELTKIPLQEAVA